MKAPSTQPGGRWVRELVGIWLVAAALGMGVRTRAAQPELAPAARAAVEAGNAALRDGRFEAARESFRAALNQVPEGPGRAVPWFFLGLTDQQAAEASAVPSAGDALLRSALDAYLQANRARPGSAGILNNLGQLRLRLGQTNEALSDLAAALEASDTRRPVYARNYAEALLGAGRWRDACRFYAWVAGEQPQEDGVWGKLVGLCLEKGPDLLGWYLWDLARSGHVLTVARHALASIQSPLLTQGQKEELMALVAYCLGQLSEPRSEFAGSELGRSIAGMTNEPVIGEGMRALALLHTGDTFPAEALRWWNRPSSGEAPAPRGMWPRDAFMALARSLAARERGPNRVRAAEALLMAAIELRPRRADPEALMLLANLYFESGQVAKIDEVLRKYRVELFEAKGEAYAASDLDRIYRYHVALGVIYSHLGRWTSEARVDSAEFQLRNALRVADEMASQGGGPTAALHVPTQLVTLLADGYAKAGQTAQATQVRVERAERYLAAGQKEEARVVVRPVLEQERTVPLSGEAERTRLKRIETQLRSDAAAPRAEPTGRAGTGSVEVDGVARAVAGVRGRQSLSDADRQSLTRAVSEAVAAGDAATPGGGRGEAIRTLSTNGVPGMVQEVRVAGDRGAVLFRQGTNLWEVPFQLKGRTAPEARSLRVVRP